MSTLAKLLPPSKEEMESLKRQLTEQRQQLLTLANSLDGCYLDGEPARLELPSPNSRRNLWVVRAGERWAQFSEGMVEEVVRHCGGKFRTRLVRAWASL